ncbi:MAG: hypothetical protein WCC87_01405 [Candidatus Korobacteraceae bacterium]
MPVKGGVVISVTRMNRILEVDFLWSALFAQTRENSGIFADSGHKRTEILRG